MSKVQISSTLDSEVFDAVVAFGIKKEWSISSTINKVLKKALVNKED